MAINMWLTNHEIKAGRPCLKQTEWHPKPQHDPRHAKRPKVVGLDEIQRVFPNLISRTNGILHASLLNIG